MNEQEREEYNRLGIERMNAKFAAARDAALAKPIAQPPPVEAPAATGVPGLWNLTYEDRTRGVLVVVMASVDVEGATYIEDALHDAIGSTLCTLLASGYRHDDSDGLRRALNEQLAGKELGPTQHIGFLRISVEFEEPLEDSGEQPAPAVAAPAVAPVVAPALPSTIAVGAAVLVTWSDGNRYPATVMQLAQGQYLIAFPNGQQHWLAAQWVTPA